MKKWKNDVNARKRWRSSGKNYTQHYFGLTWMKKGSDHYDDDNDDHDDVGL